MARKKTQENLQKETVVPARRALHDVLRSRKAAPHRKRSEKRVAQKLRHVLDDAE